MRIRKIREVNYQMKKVHLMLASLLCIGVLASCSTETTSSEEPSSSADQTSSVFSTSIEDDPYAEVLEGLDTSLGTAYETYTDSEDAEIGGAYGYSVGNVAYGWVEYTSWGSSYGVAIAITFDAETEEAIDVVIGAPADGTHNYTPYYAMSYEEGYAEYLVYLANVESAVDTAVLNYDAAEIYTAFEDSVLDPTASTYTPGESLVGAGATQTDARLGIAIKYAAESYIVNLEDPASEDFAVASYESAASTASTYSNLLSDENGDYLVGACYYTSWGAYYGAAVKIGLSSDKTITSVEFGVPFAEAHNFTPMYKTSAPLSYWNYVHNFASVYSNLLVGQTVNSDLINAWAGYGVITTTDDEGNSSTTYTSPDSVTVDAGATQSYARASMAVYAALQYAAEA